MQYQTSQLLATISKLILSKKDQPSLMRSLYEEVLPAFKINNMSLFIIHETENFYYDLTDIFPSDYKDQFEHLPVASNHQLEYQGTPLAILFEQLKKKRQPILFHSEKDFNNEPRLPINKLLAGSCKEIYATLLQTGKEAYGIWCFNSAQSDTQKKTDALLFQQLADFIAIALYNIFTAEELVAEKQFKETLLSITESISSIQDRKELFSTIFQKIAPVIPMDDTAIVVLNEDGTKWKDWSNIDNYHDSTAGFRLHEAGFISSLEIDVITKRSLTATDIVRIDDYISIHHPFADIMSDTGLKEFMFTPMIYHGKTIGSLFFDSKKYGTYTAAYFKTFKAIAKIIAIAVSNILAKEEREKEKNLLLEISLALSQVRTADDLLKQLMPRLRQLFVFDYAVITTKKKTENFFTVFRVEKELLKKEHSELYNKLIAHKYYLAGFYEEHFKTGNAFIFNPAEEFRKNPDIVFMEWMDQTGIKETMSVALESSGQIIGCLSLHSHQQHIFNPFQFSLFKSISQQFATALSNILATEEVLEREKEKSILLSISQQISQIRDLDTLLNWLHQEAGRMHQSDHVMIVLTSPAENTLQLILGDADIAWQQAAGLRPKKGLVNTPTPYRKSIFEYIESLPEGELYSAADLNFPDTFNFCTRKFQLAESFYVRLIHKGEPIGHISFHTFVKGIFRNIDIGLCKNFANQIAVSLINILSNEAILEREKRKTLEIKINNAVLKNNRFEDVLKEVTESIDNAVGCDICYIRIRSEEIDVKPFNILCQKNDHTYSVKTRENVLKEMSVKHSDIEKDINDFFRALDRPLILTGEALEDSQHQFNYLKAFRNTFNIHSFAFIPLHVKGKAKVQLIIGSKRRFAYVDNDLDIINQIIPQLSLTLDNRLAFVQIEKLKEMLETENLYLHEEINDNYNFNEIVGSSEALRTVFSQASLVAGTDTTVLIGGETGTGKELIARAIHNLSGRKDKIMVKVNCACLPAQLIESELFGHEKGAFTGAVDKRIGKFELASGGTIFLDEIGELPLELQSKLLRVIQEREFERIGGRSTLKTDIRIIAATNKNLETESSEKRFRSDLYYRLNVFPIVIPSLKNRKEDIPLLAMHFAKKFGQKMRKNITSITNEALQEMMLYDWPGNIRELEHVIEHSVISSKSNKLILGRPLLTNKTTATNSLNEFKLKSLNDNEREHIIAILKYCNGRVRGRGGAAQILDIHPNTLESRMQRLGIKKEFTS